MSVRTIALVCAVLGGVVSVAYVAFGAMGIRSLRGFCAIRRRER